MATWQEVKAAALKILGDDAEVPDIPDSSSKALKGLKKAGDEFEKSRAACEDKLLALRNANASVRSDLNQLRAKAGKWDFNLDPKNKDDQKKIQKARELFLDAIDDAIQFCVDDDKSLDDVDKQLTLLEQKAPDQQNQCEDPLDR